MVGIESCFVSLPLNLIQTLLQTSSSSLSGSSLPSFLALELRSRSTADLWHVAWCGSPSSSPAIEIAQQYAGCICLPDCTIVQVRAVSSLPNATLVTIEPNSEDDWEVLELNAELAEAAILKQVKIVHNGMRFPLWLHGRAVITFHVISTLPNTPVVQLVPGAEVAVAPKRRERSVSSSEDSSIKPLNEEHSTGKALLRVQDQDDKFLHKFNANGIEMRVVLTSVIFIHPETAKYHSLDSQKVVVVPRLASKESFKNHESATVDTDSTVKQLNDGIINMQEYRQAIVHLLISETVAKGHVMLSKSLRLYLRATLHSWIYVKRCNFNFKKEVPLLSLSPFRFKVSGNSMALEKHDPDDVGNRKSYKAEKNSDAYTDKTDWSLHDRVVAAFGNAITRNDGAVTKPNSKKGLLNLLHFWCSAQLHALGSYARDEAISMVLGNESLLHFVVKDYKSGTYGKEHTSYTESSGIRNMDGGVDVMFVLSTSEEPMRCEKFYVYELAFDKGNPGDNNLKSPLLGDLGLRGPINIHSVAERTSQKLLTSKISSLEWMGTAASDVISRLVVQLSFASGLLLSGYNLPLPGHVLIHGPPGSGKTLLATAVAQSVEEHEDILAHIVFVTCSKLALEKSATIRKTLSGYLSEALDHAPSLVILDDLDSIISSSSDSEGSQLTSSSVELAQFLKDIIDEYEEKRGSSCGIGPIAFLASAQSLGSIPQSLSSSGRFDFHVQLPAPAASERGALLKHEIQKRALQCSDDMLFEIASKCDGYDAYDLEILVDRAVHASIGRFLPSQEHENHILLKDDFLHAMQGFLPVSMRDITKSTLEDDRAGWQDVGGLNDIRNAIKDMIELPSKFPDIFAQAPLRLRSNVLLYGPPGCGKTHIVGAAAAACSLRFISVKGPELLNKYIGASEQAVRDIFSKAAAAAPCLLFFDEFDSIAPKRGHDNTGVTDRVVNQFLTELDGVEVLTGVFVFAATSRPDLLDAALLRPGRLDRLLFCDFPSKSERLDILTVLSRKLPMASDIDLDAVASITEGFSGADLQALLSDAQLAAVHDLLDSAEITDKPNKLPLITNRLLYSVTSRARPSVSEAEKQRLYSIYHQFLDSKRSVASQARDAKGKRATLA